MGGQWGGGCVQALGPNIQLRGKRESKGEKDETNRTRNVGRGEDKETMVLPGRKGFRWAIGLCGEQSWKCKGACRGQACLGDASQTLQNDKREESGKAWSRAIIYVE